uniref:Secreted protein n=1 Tax=Globodera pallida TaxID=36090 RepID=A0A183BIY9_GLOPA
MCCNSFTDMWMCCCCCQVTKGAQAVAWICLAVLPFFSGIPIIVGELRGKPTHGILLPAKPPSTTLPEVMMFLMPTGPPMLSPVSRLVLDKTDGRQMCVLRWTH